MVVRERGRSGADADGPGRAERGRRAARRAVVGALVGALLMLAAAGALAATGADLTVLGLSSGRGSGSTPAASTSDAPDAADAPGLAAAPGTCLAWTRDDASDVAVVDCARPHLFETAGAPEASLPEGAPFPGDAVWQQFVADRCLPLARTYLDGRLDPAGRYRAGALKPTRAAWESGERTVRCGLQAPGRTGALYPSTGRVADADQAAVFPPGTCLGLAGKEVSDPVDCAGVHAAEVVGPVDLAGRFPGAVPAVAEQDDFLQQACTTLSQQRLGGPQQLADTKLTVYWTNLAPESWDAGTRRVDCNLGALLPDGSGFAPLTGAARTGVVVGGDAAASPVPTLRAGAPAPLPPELAAALTPAPGAPAPAPTPGPSAAPVTPAPSATPPTVPGGPTSSPGATVAPDG